MLTPDFVRFIPPAHSDEAALELSQLLRQLSQRFDECFREQIRRAQRAHREKHLRLTEKPRSVCSAEQAFRRVVRQARIPSAPPISYAEAQIRAKVRAVVDDETRFGVLSTGERITVALVLDRYDLLQRAWGTIAECVYRLGEQWTKAALRVQRDGWDDTTA